MHEMTGSGGIYPSITEWDLQWWLGLAPTLDWIWAKTYAKSAPHHYVVLGRTPGMSRADFVRAGAVIRTFGRPGRFHGSTNIYLRSGDVKWWTMDRRVKDTDLVNRASTDRVYGPQDAPSTHTGVFTEYDRVAVDYDLRRPDPDDQGVAEQVAGFFGGRPPRTLDVGCGTGRLLDLGVVAPATYTGVDCSQGMLNELVMKHPTVARLVPARFEDVTDADLGGPFELVVAMGVPAVDVDRLHRLSSGLVVVT